MCAHIRVKLRCVQLLFIFISAKRAQVITWLPVGERCYLPRIARLLWHRYSTQFRRLHRLGTGVERLLLVNTWLIDCLKRWSLLLAWSARFAWLPSKLYVCLYVFSFFSLNARFQWHFTAATCLGVLCCAALCATSTSPFATTRDACTAFKDRTQTSQELCSYKDDVWILFLINKFVSTTNRCKGIQYLKNVTLMWASAINWRQSGRGRLVALHGSALFRSAKRTA